MSTSKESISFTIQQIIELHAPSCEMHVSETELFEDDGYSQFQMVITNKETGVKQFLIHMGQLELAMDAQDFAYKHFTPKSYSSKVKETNGNDNPVIVLFSGLTESQKDDVGEHIDEESYTFTDDGAYIEFLTDAIKSI